jgi:hypothetical protein
MCMINPISCIFCIQPQEKAKKQCLESCSRILNPFGASIKIKGSATEEEVQWVSLQPSTAAAASTGGVDSHSRPLDPGYKANNNGADEAVRAIILYQMYEIPVVICVIATVMIFVWALIVLLQDHDYWEGCAGKQHSEDTIN